MENTESDLLVDISSLNCYEDANPTSNDHTYDNRLLKESLVQDRKNENFPEHEGNVNSAMDLLPSDHNSISSMNSRAGSVAECNMEILSDCEQSLLKDKVTVPSGFVSAMNKQDHPDSLSLSGDGNKNEAGRPIFNPRNPSTPTHSIPKQSAYISPHFPNSNVSFPSSRHRSSPSTKQWREFGEDKENNLPSVAFKPKLSPARPPPAIPERKSLSGTTPLARSSPIQHTFAPPTSPNDDLLSMNMDDLQNHLSDATSSPITNRPKKPAIPPRKSLFSSSSTYSKTDLSDLEFDPISLSLTEGHINHAHSSSSSSSPLPFPMSQPMKGPPVPPRKNAPKIEINIVTALTNSATSSKLDSDARLGSSEIIGSSTTSQSTSCPSWAKFADLGIDSADFHNNISDVNSSVIQNNEEPNANDLESAEDKENAHWSKQVSPDTRSAIKKKGTGGIEYLSLENDDCEAAGSSESIAEVHKPAMVSISLPENDLSPVKPLSQWATFQNEEDDDYKTDANVDNISCGANSLPSIGMNSSGLAGSFNDVDVADLDDGFSINPNRLSTEIPNLKGFNRADRGSQNNLVDFSDDRGSMVVSMGSHEDDDEDVETIFDLTAQGDSLKRKRPKGSITVVANVGEDIYDGSIDSDGMIDAPGGAQTTASFHVGPAGLNDYIFADEEAVFNLEMKNGETSQRQSDIQSSCSSRAATPATYAVDIPYGTPQSPASTNPFWSSSTRTPPTTGSQSSSVDTPFDKFFSGSVCSVGHDKSKPRTPICINPVSSPSTPVQLVRIPPPPLSHSRSSSRQRRSSQAKERTRHTSHDSRKKLELDSTSESSQSVSTLPLLRAETPIFATTNKGIVSETGATPTPITQSDHVFEPFSVEPWPNSMAESTGSNDLFSWPNDSQPVASVTEQTNVAEAVTQNTKFAMGTSLVNQCASTTISSQMNHNSNAKILQPAIPNELGHNGENIEDSNYTAVLAPNLLSNLNFNLSVGSPVISHTENDSILPEIELIEPKTSWDAFMRFPITKRTMSHRRWDPIHIKLDNDQVCGPRLMLQYSVESIEPFHIVRLCDPRMQILKPKLHVHMSDDGQNLGKLHSLKIVVMQYIEKQTFSPRRSLNRATTGFKHTCKGTQPVKLGFSLYHDVMSFMKATGDAMFYAHKRIPKSETPEHKTTVNYHSRDEILIDVVDEVQALVCKSGDLKACKVRVHFFVASFLSGDPMAKIKINDRKVKGKEIVRREDIIPTSLNQWIDVRKPELHESCASGSFDIGNVGTCMFYPPDACRFELMRFATDYGDEKLPLIVKSTVTAKGARLQLRCKAQLYNHINDQLGMTVCENIMIRFPIPEEWGAFFRVEGKFRNHSIRAKRSAKPKKTPALASVTMEATIGVAKYEKSYNALVWRIPKLPAKGDFQDLQAFSCCIELVSNRDLEKLCQGDTNNTKENVLNEKFKFCEVEYIIAGPIGSKVCVRSFSLPNTDRAEKFVSYNSHFFYKVGIDVSVENVSGEDEVNPAALCMTQ